MAESLVSLGTTLGQGAERGSLPSSLIPELTRDTRSLLRTSAEVQITDIRRIASPYSKVFRVGLSSGDATCSVYLKFAPDDSPIRDVWCQRLADEFEVLKSLEDQRIGGYVVGSVRPVGLYLDYPALATLGSDGKTMAAFASKALRVFAPAAKRTRMVEYARACARWLRYFHESTARAHQEFDVAELIGYADIRLQSLIRSDRVDFPKQLSNALLVRVRSVASSLHRSENFVAARHGDFAGHNIIVADREVRVLDFSMVDSASTAYDVCNFWIVLESLKTDPRYSVSAVAAAQAAFLEACGNVSTSDPAFRLARFRYTVTRLLTAVNVHARNPLQALERSRQIRRSIAWLREFLAQ